MFELNMSVLCRKFPQRDMGSLFVSGLQGREPRKDSPPMNKIKGDKFEFLADK